jgi:hypothetical protein
MTFLSWFRKKIGRTLHATRAAWPGRARTVMARR